MAYIRKFWILAALLLVLVAPLALRKKSGETAPDALQLVIISPHNEAIRYEFSRAFDDYYFKKHGKHVHIDWRTPGGTSEIARYLASEYLAAFQNHWEHELHRPWNDEVKSAFDNPKVAPNASPAAIEARREFLSSNVSSGLDLFFGGGSFDFIQQANAGRLVDCGVIAKHPELFNDKAIPQTLGGETYWDTKGRWIGVCLSAYGICYNTDVIRLLKIEHPPRQWSDLADPRYFGKVALGNPGQSGSVGKAFEMLIQQQMIAKNSAPEGWLQAMQLLQKICANARYFSDSATKIPFDVESGDAAAGMCIDFYGRFQSEAARQPNGTSRMEYITPEGGSSYGVDPVGLLRGAPHADLAKEFIEFTLTTEGQKLWNWKVGTPDGPEKYALRRLPILPSLYAPEFAQYRSDPDVFPYAQANAFVYHDQWTSPLFRAITFVIRVMCIEPHDEQREAWQALIVANFPPEATATFFDVSSVDYAAASGPIREALRTPTGEIQLARTLGEQFRAQYRKAAQLAREGK